MRADGLRRRSAGPRNAGAAPGCAFALRIAGRCAGILLLLGLSACQPGVLDPAGPVGAAQRSILIGSVVIMLCIIVPTILATLGFAWWFRADNPRAKRMPDWAYSGRVELVTWAVPLLTVTLLGGVAWVGSHQLDPARPLESKVAPLEVQVVSLDWKWLFILPEQRVASVNELAIPTGTPVHFQITSASVLNTFFVPQLGSMIYAMNGMASEVHLQADQAGTYRGQSSHYSGDNFSDMHFAVRALDAAGFAAWVEAARRGGPALDGAAYAELARQGVWDKPGTYRDVDPHLFQRIVSQELPPGPGPDPVPQPKQAAAAQDAAAQPAITGTARTASLDAAICIAGER